MHRSLGAIARHARHACHSLAAALATVAATATATATAAATTAAATLPTPAHAQAPEPPPAPPVTLPAFTGYAHPDADAMRRKDDGTVPRCDGQLVFYVHAPTTGALQIELLRTDGAPATQLRVDWASQTPGATPATTTTALPANQRRALVAAVTVQQPGYHRITLANVDGSPLRNLASLVLSGPAAKDLHANTIERRNAASVHLGYPVPKEHRDDVEWFYLEVTPRTDPVCSYYMATGWHRGYFGMQVNSPSERRIIFSVWDAGDEAVDRDKVAADLRVQLVAKGEGVHAGGFGNEGTGGHSHLVHDWRLGETFRFLLHARTAHDTTTYTGWFWFAAQQRWGLIASFRAPKDGRRPHGLYSFSENFSGAHGDRLRECEFGNGWIRTPAGEWLPLQDAYFTHDETGKAARSDRHGGVRGERFYLRHGDFTAAPAGAVGTWRGALRVPRQAGQPPTDTELPTPPEEKNR